jgi:hypothetical protein
LSCVDYILLIFYNSINTTGVSHLKAKRSWLLGTSPPFLGVTVYILHFSWAQSAYGTKNLHYCAWCGSTKPLTAHASERLTPLLYTIDADFTTWSIRWQLRACLYNVQVLLDKHFSSPSCFKTVISLCERKIFPSLVGQGRVY